MNQVTAPTTIQGTAIDFVIVDDLEYKPRQHPQVGDSIEIKHEVKRANDGQVLGLQRNARSINTEVTRVYLDGSIGTSCGAVWEVKLSGGRCKWETVNNFVRKELE